MLTWMTRTIVAIGFAFIHPLEEIVMLFKISFIVLGMSHSHMLLRFLIWGQKIVKPPQVSFHRLLPSLRVCPPFSSQIPIATLFLSVLLVFVFIVGGSRLKARGWGGSGGSEE